MKLYFTANKTTMYTNYYDKSIRAAMIEFHLFA